MTPLRKANTQITKIVPCATVTQAPPGPRAPHAPYPARPRDDTCPSAGRKRACHGNGSRQLVGELARELRGWSHARAVRLYRLETRYSKTIC